MNNLKEKCLKIKMLLLDVDGVLTDGSIILGNNDLEHKSFNIKDGLGIRLLQEAGIDVGIITGRKSDAVSKRAKELSINILYQGQKDKIAAFEEIMCEHELLSNQIAYMGDDLPDLVLLKRSGLSLTVSDACDEVKQQADYITQKAGGKGAVREAIEWILKNQNKWYEVIQNY